MCMRTVVSEAQLRSHEIRKLFPFGLARARCARFVFKCLIGCGSAWMYNNAPRHPNCDDAKRE
jgi:hypothetical protein